MTQTPDPKCNVLVVEGSGPARTAIVSALREIGYANVSGVASISDANGYLEAEPCGWVVTDLTTEAAPNALHLLRMALVYPELKDTRISVLVDPASHDAIAQALALGALSWHPRDYRKETLKAEFTEYKRIADEAKGDACQVASEFVRKHLLAKKDHEGLLRFERALLAQFPANARILLSLAKAHALAKEDDKAASTLAQVLMLDPSRAPEVEKVRIELLHGMPLAKEGGKMTNLLGIRTAVVVDPDEAVLRATGQLLNELGADRVELFSSAPDALKALQGIEDPDLIVHEWRLPKVNGPVFIQKVRQIGHERTPIVILSSLVTAADQHLTREMGVARVIAKPLVKEEFLEGTIWTMKQEVRPTDIKVFERKILALLQARKFDEATKLKMKLEEGYKVNRAVALYFEAEIAYHRAQYDTAKTSAIEAIKLGMNSVRLFNLLGKTLMRLREYDAALRCFEKAQAMSPLNVLRLCAMADVQCELSKFEGANASVAAAKQVDVDNMTIDRTEASVALTSGDLRRASNILKQLPNLEDVISYLNNRGIMLARDGKTPEAVEYYGRVLESLPEKTPKVAASVYYNLALAHARGGDLEKALASVGHAKPSERLLSAKIASLQKRLELAVKSNTAFELKVDAAPKDAVVPGTDVTLPAGGDGTEPAPVIDAATYEAITALSIGPGDVGCYGIFHLADAEAAKKMQELAKGLPSYKPRGSIRRETASGVERMMKRAN